MRESQELSYKNRGMNRDLPMKQKNKPHKKTHQELVVEIESLENEINNEDD